MKRALLSAALVAAMLASPAIAGNSQHAGHPGSHRSSPRHSSHPRSSRPRHAAGRSRSSRASPGVKRDAQGRIARSAQAKDQFRKTHPCPATGKRYGACPGWVIDHIQALKHGGADAPWNMQWQTRAAAKAKDRWE